MNNELHFDPFPSVASNETFEFQIKVLYFENWELTEAVSLALDGG